MSINFCHISPSNHLDDFCDKQSYDLTLAHLLEKDSTYLEWYKNNRGSKVIIQDNSAFECYKANEPMYPADKLLDIADLYGPDYIVMSDYPNESSSKTIQSAIELAPKFKNAGYGTFFVPQSKIGDYEDYIAGFAWATCSPLVDYIGVSILGVPNAYGVESNNKMQRYVSRFAMLSELRRRGILNMARINNKKIHMLGMVDGPNEIELVSQFHPFINTWDSSSAIWAGLNGISYDSSPTGLIDGKFEKEVDFSFKTEDDSLIKLAQHNKNIINEMCKGNISGNQL